MPSPKGPAKQVVQEIEEADFILCTGTDQGDLDYYRPILEKAHQREPAADLCQSGSGQRRPGRHLEYVPGHGGQNL